MIIARASKIGAIGLVGFLIVSAIIAAMGIEKIRFGGDLHSQNAQMSAFNADTLPPPLYLVEPFHLANVMAVHPESYDINDNFLNGMEQEYNERLDHWSNSTLDDGLREELLETARTDGDRFWTLVNNTLKPSVRRGDQATVDRPLDELLETFRSHRTKINALVKQTEQTQAELAASSESSVFRPRCCSP